MTSPEPPEVLKLKQVFELIDIFEGEADENRIAQWVNAIREPDGLTQILDLLDLIVDENERMAADILQRNPDARRLARLGISPDAARIIELAGREGEMHLDKAHTAQLIGVAMRKHFGLPPKDED